MPELVDRPLPAPTGEASSRWPPVVRAELTQRRRDLLARSDVLAGNVLDLSDPESLAAVLDAGRQSAGAPPPAAERYDVVLSIAALVAVADLPRVLRGVERLLDPDGRFLFVEPVSRPGWTGLLSASAGSLLNPVRRQHLGRDVPRAIRQAGFIITDIERFTMPTTVWPLRDFVEGCGRPRTGFAGEGTHQEGTR